MRGLELTDTYWEKSLGMKAPSEVYHHTSLSRQNVSCSSRERDWKHKEDWVPITIGQQKGFRCQIRIILN